MNALLPRLHRLHLPEPQEVLYLLTGVVLAASVLTVLAPLASPPGAPTAAASAAQATPTVGARGQWLTVWSASGSGGAHETAPLPPDGAISWTCDAPHTPLGAQPVPGYFALTERTGDVWPGVAGTCPMYGGARISAHGPTLDLTIAANTTWTLKIEVWKASAI